MTRHSCFPCFSFQSQFFNFILSTRNQLLFQFNRQKKEEVEYQTKKYKILHHSSAVKYTRINSEDNVQFCTTHHLDYR